MVDGSFDPDNVEWWNLMIATQITYCHVVIIITFLGLVISMVWQDICVKIIMMQNSHDKYLQSVAIYFTILRSDVY